LRGASDLATKQSPVKIHVRAIKPEIASPPNAGLAMTIFNYMPTNIRARFAPSPTGWLHIGSLRTALFGYLIAKTLGGKFILRVEDTDQKREVAGAVESLIKILDWTGIRFDEGPHLGGDYGPYVQSQRLAIYEKYAEQLLAENKAYRCFCSAERLEKMRQGQQAKKLPPRYDRACRELAETEVNKKLAQGEKFVIRQKMPLAGQVIVRDELRGDIKFQAQDLEDQILIKSDGMPTYQFAVVVDDHLMAISHVLRGDEWLSSFPKNILLYRDFNWPAPKFIHLTLTLNKTGGKLSKRQGDVAVEDYRAKGYLAEALLNFCALLGWHPKEDNEILLLDDMIKKFRYQDMGTSPAIFDVDKLDYFNGWHIRHKPLADLAKLCLPYLGKNQAQFGYDYIKKVVSLEQERLKKLSEIGELTEFFFTDEISYQPELLVWKKMTLAQVKNNLRTIFELLEKIPDSEWTDDSLEEAIMDYLKAKQLKTGEPASTRPSLGGYLWPLRASLTGRAASPGPFAVAEVLGKERSLKRINQAIKKL